MPNAVSCALCSSTLINVKLGRSFEDSALREFTVVTDSSTNCSRTPFNQALDIPGNSQQTSAWSRNDAFTDKYECFKDALTIFEI